MSYSPPTEKEGRRSQRRTKSADGSSDAIKPTTLAGYLDNKKAQAERARMDAISNQKVVEKVRRRTLSGDRRRARKHVDEMSCSSHTATTASTMTASLNSPTPRGNNSLSSHSSLLASTQRRPSGTRWGVGAPPLINSPVETGHITSSEPLKGLSPICLTPPNNTSTHYLDRRRIASPTDADTNEGMPSLLSNLRAPPAPLESVASNSNSSSSSSATVVHRKVLPKMASERGLMGEASRRSGRPCLSLDEYRQISQSMHSLQDYEIDLVDKNPSPTGSSVQAPVDGVVLPPPPPLSCSPPPERKRSSSLNGSRHGRRRAPKGSKATPRVSNRRTPSSDDTLEGDHKPNAKSTKKPLPTSKEALSPRSPGRDGSVQLSLSPAHHRRGSFGRRSLSRSYHGASPGRRVDDMTASMERFSFMNRRDIYRNNGSYSGGLTLGGGSSHTLGSLTMGSTSMNQHSTSTHATFRSMNSTDHGTAHSRVSLASYRSARSHFELQISPTTSPIVSAPNSDKTLGNYTDSSADLDSDEEATSICSDDDDDLDEFQR